MSQQGYAMLPQTRASVDHILKHYETYKQEGRRLPMVVGLSGCQGSGKTTLCDTLAHVLKENHGLNVVQFSLDDLYLTHKDQLLLSQKYKTNPLYQQRGQAGSHDLELAKQTFESLGRNEGTVAIPVYDKSLHDGKGDRLERSQWKYVKTPVDIVLFEGWMVGFKPVQKIQQDALVGCTVQDALVMNQLLKKYQKDIYPFFDIFIHLSPFDIAQVYQWRLQQEHHMKASRGVNGLSDEQVKKFVDSYMPAYQLYLPRLDKMGFFGYESSGDRLGFEGRERGDGGYSAPRRHLKIVLDQDRRVVESDTLLEPGSIVAVKPVNYTVFYRFAVVGILGLIGYKRHSIMKSIYSSWHSLKK
ncbi:hypothetical protein MFLAVUS_000048 [Mucor flavus]|uniref:SRP54-type proteins GTP-binding domain-containing protein n=1 Tax=Mucor flavus TaxID=439312 RepID=A0ABP9YIM6_9FUNG